MSATRAVPAWATRRATVVLAALVAAGAVLIFAGQPWLNIQPQSTIVRTDNISVSGQDMSPLLTACAVVALAAAGALTLAGRIAARIIAGCFMACGIGVVWISMHTMADPLSAAAHKIAETTGTFDTSGAVELTALAAVTAVAGAALVGCGGWLLSVHRHFVQQRKYQVAPAATAPFPATDTHLDEIDAWDALSAEEDPTIN